MSARRTAPRHWRNTKLASHPFPEHPKFSQPEEIILELNAIQASILRHRPQPYVGTHFALRIDNPEHGRLLIKRLTPLIASAANCRDQQSWISIGISYAGLRLLGLPETSLASFPEAFRTGMAGRAAQLMDTGPNAPSHWDPAFQGNQMHVCLNVFSSGGEAWEKTRALAHEQFVDLHGITLLGAHQFGSHPDNLNPFGYKDGISEPAIEGNDVEPLPGQGAPIKAGEFILGYPGESGEPLKMPQPDILGRNGTFLAFRKYRSRLGAFNDYLRSQASTPAGRELIAAKLVGRWRSGAPLTLAPEADDPELGADYRRNNDFTYADDPNGQRVPLGCHMRRMNPRDSKVSVMTDVNVHRLIRCGTSYGKPYDESVTASQDQDDERGVYFMLISAKAHETLEFLQREWVNNGNFQNLGDERDPLIGLHEENDMFTVPAKPVRKRLVGIQTFNVLKGGEYLFMPSLPALQWIADSGR
ncbi:Dyp-type peroxidase [Paraburkholderia haematera]|uniref:Multifunctional dye peroxidase DyP2 n=1 Tax=Paraburkholderia haematera TaxID=2793077 RepID=A0ABM8RT57_9BURK|nr:peroxidase [Paraburkholderia haematera]CAE6770110.1 Multifunctional dye peroxidase DyP2 [Paraburkholderia haematera]